MVEIWLATFNPQKVKEFEAVRQKQGLPIAFRVASEIPGYSSPPEVGKTFRDNALIKAKSLAAVKPNTWVIAEDSGLAVKGLDGLPGIHSAHYAGKNASDLENNLKLLKMLQLKGITDRSAEFICYLVAISPDGQIQECEGRLPGVIATEPRGSFGFGYDPLFIPVGQSKTLAELGPVFKNQNSHRALAFQNLLKKINNFDSSPSETNADSLTRRQSNGRV